MILEKKIADKIRQMRKSKGLTLSQLAQAVELSVGLLSRIENNQVSPPIATLAKISRGLGVPIAFFFQEGDDHESYAVTTQDQRKPIVRPGTRIGFSYYSLTELKKPHVIEPFIIKYPVIVKEPKVLFDHPGEEFLFVLEGEIDLVYGKEKIRLRSGDAIHFDPSIPHRGQNVTKSESKCLVVVVNEAFIKNQATPEK